MKTFPSFIFSSSTLVIQSIPRSFWILPSAILLSLFVAEILCSRIVGSDNAWRYWSPEAAFKFIEFKETNRNKNNLLFVGDSTAYNNFNPSIFTRKINSDINIWNIGWPGNFPLAFEKSTLPFIKKHEFDFIVCSLIPTGFFADDNPTDSEASILSSPVCKSIDNDWMFSDWLNLAKLWPAIKMTAGKDISAIREQVKSNRGFHLLNGTKEITITNNAEPAILSPRRLKVLSDLILTCERQGSKLLIVIPPSRDKSQRRMYINKMYESALAEFGTSRNVMILQIKDDNFTEEDFYNLNHLNREGSKIISNLVADAISKFSRQRTSQ